MDISDLLKQFNSWKENSNLEAVDHHDARQQLQEAKTEEFLIRGKTILKQFENLEKAQQHLIKQKEQLTNKWQKLQSECHITASLETGETIQVDLSSDPRIQQLWLQRNDITPQQTTATEPAEPEHLQLEDLKLEDLSATNSEQASVYNPELLSQESDELLTHLT